MVADWRVEGGGRLDNLARGEKCAVQIIRRTLFLMAFEARRSQLLRRCRLNRWGTCMGGLRTNQIGSVTHDSTDGTSYFLCEQHTAGVYIYTLKLSGFYIFAHYNQRFPVSSLPEEVSHNFGSDRMSTHVGCGVSSLSRSTPNGNTRAVPRLASRRQAKPDDAPA